MSYAHVTNGQVDQIGQPPRLHFDGTRWWDLRSRDPQLLASLGWLPVVEVTRPADTETATSDLSHAMVAGQPTQVWTPRPWTADELAAKQAEVNREAARLAVRQILSDIDAEIDRARTVKQTANATVKSNPAPPYINDLATALIRIGQAAKDLARFVRDQ